MKKIFVVLCCIGIVQFSQAQSVLLDSAKNELYKVNKVFDSSEYLGFNMNINYVSDSGSVQMATDAMSGVYVLNKKNLYYRMGGTEYIQTDSFSYTVYKDEQMMIMTKNFVTQNSEAFPLKNFVDSIIQNYGSIYTITIDSIATDSVDYYSRIKFTADSAALSSTPNGAGLYRYFYVDFYTDSHLPLKLEFSYNDYAGDEDSIPTPSFGSPVMLTKTVTMVFSNYKAYTATEIFDDYQYIIYNRQRKIYEPADKYKTYKFITSGFDNEDPDAQYYRQVPYEGNN